MSAALHHALLGVAGVALAAAGIRAASSLVPSGPPRAVVAMVLAAAAAVGEMLVLAIVSLAGSSLALAAAAVATWLAVRALLPPPDVPLGEELAGWWSARASAERVLAGAVGGAAAAWALWQLRNPAIGFDSVHYHLPEIVAWVQGGRAGKVENLVPGLPTGNYPLTSEVTVSWAMAISRSFVAFTLWPWATLALTAAAGWVGLRALRVPPLVAGLALGALCTNPWLLAWQSNGGMTDPPALAWLVACAALCTLARERPVLLAPAIVAAGLSVGSKTTTLPLAALVLVLGLYGIRGSLRTVRAPLAAASCAALAVGGVWYLRNLLDHGSPFWPIVAAPWGDPVPHAVSLVKTSFLQRPRATVDHLGHAYVHRFGGGVALLAGGVLAPLLARRARVIAAGGVTAVGFLVWARSPVTGLPHAPGLQETIFSTTRYLLPVVAAAVLALALAASERRRSGRVAVVVLAAALAIDLVQTFDLGVPTAPSALVPLAGAGVGAVVAGALRGVPRRLRSPRLAPAYIAIAAALLAIPASTYVQRFGKVSRLFTSSVVRWLASEPRYRDGNDPVAITPAPIGPLAGDDLGHRVAIIGHGEPCPAIAARARSQWLVVYGGRLGDAVPVDVGRCLPGVRPAFDNRLFIVYRPGG